MMPWRKWNVIIVLILANYVVFGLFAAFVFPVRPQAPLSHPAQPTFTPGAPSPQRVGTLSYDFLTPSPIVRATNTSTWTRTPIATTETPTDTTPTSATTAAPATATIAPTAAATLPPTSTATGSAPTGTATAPALLAPRPLATATTRP